MEGMKEERDDEWVKEKGWSKKGKKKERDDK